MKTRRILAILTAAMVFATNTQVFAADTSTNEAYPEAVITIKADAPTLLTNEQLLELIEQAPDFTETEVHQHWLTDELQKQN